MIEVESVVELPDRIKVGIVVYRNPFPVTLLFEKRPGGIIQHVSTISRTEKHTFCSPIVTTDEYVLAEKMVRAVMSGREKRNRLKECQPRLFD